MLEFFTNGKTEFEQFWTIISVGGKFFYHGKSISQRDGFNYSKGFLLFKARSAIAKLAKKYGFKISIKEKTIMFEKD